MPPRAAFAQARCEPFRLLNFSADAVKEKDRRTPTAIESTVLRTLLVLSARGELPRAAEAEGKRGEGRQRGSHQPLKMKANVYFVNC